MGRVPGAQRAWLASPGWIVPVVFLILGCCVPSLGKAEGEGPGAPVQSPTTEPEGAEAKVEGQPTEPEEGEDLSEPYDGPCAEGDEDCVDDPEPLPPPELPDDTRVGPAILVPGIRASYPQILELPVGLLIGRWIAPAEHPASAHGVLVQAVPGLGGGKVTVGYAWLYGGVTGSHRYLVPFYGLGIKAAYLRTWRDPWNLPPGRDYLGLEAEFTYIGNLTVGAYHSPDDDLLISVGLGVGF